jgi:hypothetical protein
LPIILALGGLAAGHTNCVIGLSARSGECLETGQGRLVIGPQVTNLPHRWLNVYCIKERFVMKSKAGIKFATLVIACGAAVVTIVPRVPAQPPPPNTQLIAARNATEKELESIAIIDRKVMVPMRDGKRMATDIYRPKDTSKKYPIIFVRTPYNFNYWDVKVGARATWRLN